MKPHVSPLWNSQWKQQSSQFYRELSLLVLCDTGSASAKQNRKQNGRTVTIDQATDKEMAPQNRTKPSRSLSFHISPSLIFTSSFLFPQCLLLSVPFCHYFTARNSVFRRLQWFGPRNSRRGFMKLYKLSLLVFLLYLPTSFFAARPQAFLSPLK